MEHKPHGYSSDNSVWFKVLAVTRRRAILHLAALISVLPPYDISLFLYNRLYEVEEKINIFKKSFLPLWKHQHSLKSIFTMCLGRLWNAYLYAKSVSRCLVEGRRSRIFEQMYTVENHSPNSWSERTPLIITQNAMVPLILLDLVSKD